MSRGNPDPPPQGGGGPRSGSEGEDRGDGCFASAPSVAFSDTSPWRGRIKWTLLRRYRLGFVVVDRVVEAAFHFPGDDLPEFAAPAVPILEHGVRPAAVGAHGMFADQRLELGFPMDRAETMERNA